MIRKFFWVFAFLAAFGLAVPEFPVFGVDSAYSQAKKKKKRKNLFELLFKRKRKAKKPSASAKRKLRRKLRLGNRKKTRRKRKKRLAVAPVVPKVVKSENAAKILVVGDFMADGTGWGLERAFAADADVVVVNKSSGLSGMVREDVVNWPQAVGPLITETKPAAVVILVGMNDRQQMRTSAGKFNKLTEEWKKQYVARVNELAKAASATKLVWLGLPPVKRKSMNADYLVLNEIYRNATESVGGTFVDVWDGYTNADGKFITAGPDINGQIVRLRNSDGINMTKAGRRKLAFYAEKAVRKVTGLGTDNLLAGLPEFSLPAQPLKPEYDPAKTGRTVVVSLEGPALDGGSVLEGADKFLKTSGGEKSVSYDLVSKGSAAVPQEGRIDAGWGLPKPKTAAKKDSKSDDKAEKAKLEAVDPKAEAATGSGDKIVKKPLPTVTNITN